MYKVLTIAGSDSSCGAGVQADLKTIRAFGAYGVCAITAVTAQNTMGVLSVFQISAQLVGEQIDAVFSDIGVDSVKTGMLANEEIVEVVCDRIRRHNLKKLIVDPIVKSHKGSLLLSQEGLRRLRLYLIPESYLITPNIPEAEIITDRKIRNFSDLKDAAKSMFDLGARNVLVKGGHAIQSEIDGRDRPKSKITDLLYNGKVFESFIEDRIESGNIHGTGCVYSAAIAAQLAQGSELTRSITLAKSYVTRVIKESLQLGSGDKLICS